MFLNLNNKKIREITNTEINEEKCFYKLKFINTTKQYIEHCRLIPSNILIAFKNNRIHNKVKNNEKFLSSIEVSKNENDNSLIIRFSSIIKIIRMTIEFENSLVFAEILNLSSNNPIIKHNNNPKKKEKYSLVFVK